jgi:hypothetical protein
VIERVAIENAAEQSIPGSGSQESAGSAMTKYVNVFDWKMLFETANDDPHKSRHGSRSAVHVLFKNQRQEMSL